MFYTAIHSLYMAWWHRISCTVILNFEMGFTRYTWNHVVAVTKVGRLFTWGSGWDGCLRHNNCGNELWPKRVECGRFAGLFIVCAVAGYHCSAAINSSILVPIFLFHYRRYCDSAIYSQSLLALLSFLWILRCDATHSVRDLKRISS
jgi:hypothetical protein